MAEGYKGSCRDNEARHYVKIGKGPKNENFYLQRTKMKVAMIFFCDVSDIVNETMLQILLCALNGIMA